MPFGNSGVESQRDSGSKPKVARNELPWVSRPKATNPNGVAARSGKRDATPLGLTCNRASTWRAQSLWDCRTAATRFPFFACGFTNALRESQGSTESCPTRERKSSRPAAISRATDPMAAPGRDAAARPGFLAGQKKATGPKPVALEHSLRRPARLTRTPSRSCRRCP
jgi:hypothetical protein